jgi:NAD-dependent deacetylase
VTQNVDRLHQAAGSRGVIERHGTLWVWRCTGCGAEREEREVPFREYPPKCATCSSNRRPGVVWFGEALPAAALARATRETEAGDLFFSIGTSSIVFPAAGLLDAAVTRKIKTVELNTEATAAAGYLHWALQGKAGESLPRLVALAFGE